MKDSLSEDEWNSYLEQRKTAQEQIKEYKEAVKQKKKFGDEMDKDLYRLYGSLLPQQSMRPSAQQKVRHSSIRYLMTKTVIRPKKRLMNIRQWEQRWSRPA